LKIIYYYHIPKCGGTHIGSHMRQISKAVNGEFYDFKKRIKNLNLNFLRKKINDIRLENFLKSICKGKADFKFIHHHHGYYGISEIYHLLLREKEKAKSLGHDFYLFTCIRDPMSFQVSRINYLRNSCGMKNITFDDAITLSSNHNFMCKYFMQNQPRRWKDLNIDKNYFKKILGIMDKVFLLEEMEELLNKIESIVGVQVPHTLKRKNQGKLLITPTKSQIEKLERANHLDAFFYNLVKSNGD